jgi:heme/copper-type cytochrome/quinol oxidase subunit 4
MSIAVPAVRYGLPVLLTAIGVWLLQTQADKWGGLGVMLIGTAVIVLMLNLLFRLSIKSNNERAREEQAREFYDEHGRWPEGYGR